MEKTRIERTENERTNIERTNDDSTEIKRTENDRKGVLMEEKKEEKKENIVINLGQEYGESITESMIVKQELNNIAYLLDNFNPVTRTLVFREAMPDEETKKIVTDFTKQEMPSFLANSKAILEKLYKNGISMTDILSDILEKRRAKIPGYIGPK